jgi:hypothetical protein
MTRQKFTSILLALVFLSARAAGAQSWQDALNTMPLLQETRQLTRTNCVRVMLEAFQSNAVVKGLVFMPGATDEFYMFRRARANLTNAHPTLLDGVNALTNQTFIRVTFHPPLLLLHTDEDPVEPLFKIEDQEALQRLEAARFVPHALYNDRDWNFVQPILRKALKASVLPWVQSFDSWHFYRHSFAGWNLTGREAVQAIALAGKTKVTVSRSSKLSWHKFELRFEPDGRVRATPHLDEFPR